MKETADSPAGVQLPVGGRCLAYRQRSISIISGEMSVLTKQNQLVAPKTTGGIFYIMTDDSCCGYRVAGKT